LEWVETTGPSVDEAIDRALDLLGVDVSDAEVVVLEEARRGLLGMRARAARVRARVRPTRPRPKQDRRDRRRREARASSRVDKPTSESAQGASEDGLGKGDASPRTAKADRPPKRRGPKEPLTTTEPTEEPAEPDRGDDEDMDRERDGVLDVERAEQFLVGLTTAFGTPATATVTETEDWVDIDLEGEDLGLLIGARGLTLQAIQDLTRAVGQRGFPPQRLRIDVAGYRRRRQEALVRFAVQISEEVVRTGTPRALEPMSPADRKVVHDAVQEIDGATSSSEGEDAQRRVVISPA
jgi:spoIIIJ-associated protein